MSRSCTPLLRSCTVVVALFLMVVVVACGNASATTPFKFWTATPDFTQTPIVLTIEVTKIVETTSTPKPTPTVTTATRHELCVFASEAVYLRPSASENGYPILPLKNGTKVLDLGGRDGNWMFVEVTNKRGWINSKFVEACK